MNLKSRFNIPTKTGPSGPSNEKGKMKEKDSSEKPSCHRSVTGSVQSLIKHFSRRDVSGSRNSSGHTAVNNEGKRISSTVTATSSSSWVKLPSPQDDITSTTPSSSTSYYSSSSHIHAVRTPAKEGREEIHQQELSQVSVAETPSPLPSSDTPDTPLTLPKVRGKTNYKEKPSRIPTYSPSSSSKSSETSSPSPKTQIKVNQQGDRPSKIPSSTKPPKTVTSPGGRQPQNVNTTNKSVPGKIGGDRNNRAAVMVRGNTGEGLFQKPLQRQENLKGKIEGQMSKGRSFNTPKTNEPTRQTSRLPRSSEYSAPVASPPKRATNMRASLPAPKAFSTGLSSAQAPRRGSLPASSTQKPSTTATRPSYGNQIASRGKSSAVRSPATNATGRFPLSTNRTQSSTRATSIPQRQLLAPLGPPLPRSQTFNSLAQSQKTKSIASGKGATNKVGRISDVSGRTAHTGPQNGEEYTEVVEYLKATRPSRREIEDKKQQDQWKAKVMSAIERDTASYEVECRIIDAATSAAQNGEESENMMPGLPPPGNIMVAGPFSNSHERFPVHRSIRVAGPLDTDKDRNQDSMVIYTF
ncbi:hypothetical protein Plec18170_008460 [Paecilomyces lecythidis]